MDRLLIEEKIESLRRCVRRIEDKRVATVKEREDDWDTQDILSVNLTRAVQLCVDIAAHIIAETDEPSPNTMAEGFDRLHDIGLLPAELSNTLRGRSVFGMWPFMPTGPSTGALCIRLPMTGSMIFGSLPA